MLQQNVFNIALDQSATSSQMTKVITDTIAVAHTMGNNMLAGAIITGKCSLAKSSDGVGLSGPMKGSVEPGSSAVSSTPRTHTVVRALHHAILYLERIYMNYASLNRLTKNSITFKALTVNAR